MTEKEKLTVEEIVSRVKFLMDLGHPIMGAVFVSSLVIKHFMG